MSDTKREKRKVGFTVIINTVINDHDIKDSLGLLVYILSKPDNWKVRTTEIEKRFGMATKKRRRLFNELAAAGYAQYIQGGKGSGSHWLFSGEKKRERQKGTIAPQKARVPKGRSRQKGTVPKGHPLVNTDSLTNTIREEVKKETHTPRESLIDYWQEAKAEIMKAIQKPSETFRASWISKYGQTLSKWKTSPVLEAEEFAEWVLENDQYFNVQTGSILLNSVKARSVNTYRATFGRVWLKNLDRHKQRQENQKQKVNGKPYHSRQQPTIEDYNDHAEKVASMADQYVERQRARKEAAQLAFDQVTTTGT